MIIGSNEGFFSSARDADRGRITQRRKKENVRMKPVEANLAAVSRGPSVHQDLSAH